MSFTAKTVIFDFADNWGGDEMALRAIEFKLAGVLIDVNGTVGASAYATTEVNGDFVAMDAFDVSLSKIGDPDNVVWAAATNIEQRLVIVFDTPQTFNEIVVNNLHLVEKGGVVGEEYGVKNTKIYWTLTEYSGVIYEEVVSGTSLIFDGQIREHILFDVADDQDLQLVGVSTVYSDIFAATGFLSATVLINPILITSGIFAATGELSATPRAHVSVSSEPFSATGELSATVKIAINQGPFSATGSLSATPKAIITVTAEPFEAIGSLLASLPVTFSKEFASVFYIFTLTGSSDSVDDIDIPISSFQSTMQSGNPTFLSVVVPDATQAGAINARSNGSLRIDAAFKIDGELVQRKTIIETDFDDIAIDEGATNQSITLGGYRTETYTQKAITLTGVSYKSTKNGKIRYRLANLEVNLNPGDSVTIGTDTFTADSITFYIGDNSQTMEVAEA